LERNIKNMKISNKYDRLVRKLIAGESSSEEMEELAHWNVVETKMKKQFDAAKNIVENGAIERRIWDKIDSRCQAPVERSQKLQLRYWRVALAACITALLIIGGGIFFFDKGHTASQRIIEYTEVVSSNSRLYILPDSSKVWMQAGSRLRFSQDFMSNREVWLEGVSTFEVTKRKGHNFKVYIDQAFVEVKGTVFRVQSTCQDGAEVTLFSGKYGAYNEAVFSMVGENGRKALRTKWFRHVRENGLNISKRFFSLHGLTSALRLRGFSADLRAIALHRACRWG